jgi:hypothetical protein
MCHSIEADSCDATLPPYWRTGLLLLNSNVRRSLLEFVFFRIKLFHSVTPAQYTKAMSGRFINTTSFNSLPAERHNRVFILVSQMSCFTSILLLVIPSL